MPRSASLAGCRPPEKRRHWGWATALPKRHTTTTSSSSKPHSYYIFCSGLPVRNLRGRPRLLQEFFLTPAGQEVFLVQGKPGVALGAEDPYPEYFEGAELEVLGPGDADFEQAFTIFTDMFLGGGAAPALRCISVSYTHLTLP